MYSPKIPERYIPTLYWLGRARGRPMTHLVAEAVERYLAEEGWIDTDAGAAALTHREHRRAA